MRSDLLIKWLKTPAIYSELLEKYEKSLPSDAALKFELINQRHFIPSGVDSVIQVFKRSVEFAKFFDQSKVNASDVNDEPSLPESFEINADSNDENDGTQQMKSGSSVPQTNCIDSSNDRIPVRLSGGRRAWLEIPAPFYSADKLRLKAQIDLLLTDDELENK